MTAKLISNWTAEHAAALGNANLLVQQRLLESGLFTDENLIRAMDAHPARDLTVSVMGHDPSTYQWNECHRDGATGQELLEIVKTGRIWINLRRLMDHHQDLRDLIDAAYDELQELCPGFIATQRTANLLISSPTAIVYYHVDCPLNILWHLRGEKTCWVYPLQEPFVSQSDLEELHAGFRSEDFHYLAEWDDAAAAYELKPGDMVTWAQNTPHRVENKSGLNVSLSTEHLTSAARRQINVHLANRALRQSLGLTTPSSSADGPIAAMKVAWMRGCRQLRKVLPASNETKKFVYPVAYRIDINAPGGVAPLDEYHATTQVRDEPLVTA